jgi:type IV secretion system protein VirB4
MRLLASKGDWLWLAKWIEILLTSRGYELRADDDAELWAAIGQIAGMPESMWRLKSLALQLGIKLSEQLAPWIGDGQRARFFDNATDGFSLSDFACVEMGGLFVDPPLARAFMEYAFHQISTQLDGSPALIYVEEAWFMLGDRLFASRINEWLRTLAKKNAFLVMATQSLDEIKASSVFSSVVDNVPNRIFLPNAEAMNPARREVYRDAFSLNDAQILRIRDGIPKRQYYIVTPEISRMVDCVLPRAVVNVVRSDARAQKVFTRHLQAGREGRGQWREDYLAEMEPG